MSILSGSVQYTTDGETFVNASEPHVLVEQVQSAYTIGGTDGQGYAVVGAWQILNESAQASGVAVSGDGGASFSIIDIANDNPARFGAFPDASNFFLTFGTFPNTSSVGQPITRNIHVHSHGLNGCSIHRQRKHKAAPSDSGAWLAQIMRTTDGGVTWDLMFNDDTFYFNQIACPSTSVCFAVGENDSAAFVYRTQDAGETWDIVLNSPGMSLMAVEALSETEVYIGGGVTGGFSMVGSTFYTSDAGATWNQTQIPDVYIMALSFPDADHGFATALNVEQQSSVLIYA